MEELDLWGNVVEKKTILRELFIEPPFSTLDARQGRWLQRKKKWIGLGIKSEIGRENVKCSNLKGWTDKLAQQGKIKGNKLPSDTSIFDPVLCELIYKWFCPNGGAF